MSRLHADWQCVGMLPQREYCALLQLTPSHLYQAKHGELRVLDVIE
jgi:hypothetical protein